MNSKTGLATGRRVRRRSHKSGMAPGTLVAVSNDGEQISDSPETSHLPVKVALTEFDAESCSERELSDFAELTAVRDSSKIYWINAEGIHDAGLVEELGKIFALHPLVLEDVLNPNKRPKAEEYDDFIFLLLKMVYPGTNNRRIESEQVSLIIGKNFVLSFQELGGDVFDGVRNRLRQGKGKIRKLGSDFLAYSLIDAIVDSYFSVLESVGEEVERLEQQLLARPSEKHLKQMHRLRKLSLFLRRAAWPHRELISSLIRGDSELIGDATRLYLRDVYDHSVEILDIIETLRETLATQMEVHLSGVNNKMSSVMVVLAIVSTIFMPLTFIAGIYGMNFKYMPELDWSFGYPLVLAVMALIAAVMLVLFRKRGWI